MLSNTSRRVFGTSAMAPISQAAQRVRFFSRTTAKHNKVCVIGAAGGIGQPLSLLLGNNDMVKELRLYDVAPITPGVAADLSHINTPAQVTGYTGPDELGAALKDVDIVVCPAGVPRKPGMTRDDLFNINAGIVAGTAQAVAENCPNALFLIISNPVNSTVPIAAETLKKAGVHDPKKVFGVTTLDITRANTFIAENQGFDVHDMNVPVIGGHAGTTILPLLSHVKGANFTQEDKEKLTHRIMFGGDEVVQAKAGGGSATLSMAYAGAEFAFQCMRARAGADETACTFVECDVAPTKFFSTPVKLGPEGVKEVLPYGELDAFEQEKFDEMIPVLQEQIQKGIDFVQNK